MASQQSLHQPVATHSHFGLESNGADICCQAQIFYKYFELAKVAHTSEIQQLRNENERLQGLVKSCCLSAGAADATGLIKSFPSSGEADDAKLSSDSHAAPPDAMADLCEVVLHERTVFDVSPPSALTHAVSGQELRVLDLAMDQEVPREPDYPPHPAQNNLQTAEPQRTSLICNSIVVDDLASSRTDSGKKPGKAPKPSGKGKAFKAHSFAQTRSIESNLSGSVLTWSQFIAKFVKGMKFEMAMTSLVAANALVMVFHSQYEGIQICYDLQYPDCESAAENVWPNALQVFECFDWAFGVTFVCEALLKIACMRFGYFYGKGAGWNWLDLSCVLSFLVDRMAAASQVDGSKLRLLRLVRLMRLHRIIRRLEALDALYIMATAIKGMSRILVWAMALLLLMLSVCALILTQFLHMQKFAGVHATGLDERGKHENRELYEYFGTFTRCLLSMFELTLGNWPPVARLLSEYVSEWFMPLSLLHKMSIGFAVIGVINGVILQETFKVAALDDQIMVRQKKKFASVGRQKLVRLFESLDVSGDGAVDISEFQTISHDPEVKTWLSSMDIETDDLKTLFMLLDEDNDGLISVEELCQRIPRIKGSARSIDALVMKYKLNEIVKILNINSEILAGLSETGVVAPKVSPTSIKFQSAPGLTHGKSNPILGQLSIIPQV